MVTSPPSSNETPLLSPGELKESEDVLHDWLTRTLAYKAMYTFSLSLFRVLCAFIDLPLLVMPVICSTFNMSSNSYGTVAYFIINSFGAAVSVLHAIQKYFKLSERITNLSKACDSLQSLVFDIQMFNIHAKHKTQEETDDFLDTVEQRLLQYIQDPNIPYFIQKKFISEEVTYTEKRVKS